ncbi:ribosome maturation factor RimM [Palleronia sp. KMU-117]|uniref:ribosome maturation factor RimM n=1 Tax=Palleronia sp. KMU-117 TaxID=3434108 RepID=UPI003D727BCB
MTARICVGAIAGAFGVKGEVRLKSFCAEPAAIVDYGTLTDEAGTRRFDVTLTGQVKNGLSARLSGVRTKEEADALRGVRLYVERDRLPDVGEDEFYHADLIGLRVVDTGGTEIGTVRAVLNHGASDLLEVHAPGKKVTVLLPFTRAVVPTVDLAGGRIVADPPEGLFPED